MSKLCLWITASLAVLVGFGATANALEIFNDPHFQAGFNVYNPNGTYEGPLQYTTANGTPKWDFTQLNSKQTIFGATPTSLGDGAMHWENNYKSVTIGPTTTGEADVQLRVNAINEYNNVYRNASQPWTHLYLSERISNPNGWLGTTSPSIADMTSANYNIDVDLLKANNVYRTGYNRSIHAAQFNQYFTIQNLNAAHSKGYGDLLWFGICIYDDRAAVTSPVVMVDKGTGKLIYSMGLTDFGKTVGPQVGDWMNISGDLLPYFKAALSAAWARGMLSDSKNYDDYYIGGALIGYEIPGLSDMNMQFKNLSLNVGVAPEPGTLALLATGLVGLLAYAWRRRRS
jgi:hypothetical protein